jgi:ABC-type glycerol-3-phosphate transport system substrate-binding protein
MARIDRRTFLKRTGALGLGVAAVSAGLPRWAFAADEIDFVCQGDPYDYAIEFLIKDYLKETGKKVAKNVIGYNELHDKMMLDFSTPGADADIYGIDCVWAGEVGKYTVDHLPLLKEAGFDISDIPKPMQDMSKVGDKWYSAPLQPQCPITVMRKDVLEKKGIPVPKEITFDVIMEIAKEIHDPKNNFYGYITNLRTGAAIGQTYLHQINAYGARLFTEDFKANCNSELAIEAIQWLVDMKPYLPPDFANYQWDEKRKAYESGHIGITDLWFGRFNWVEDPEVSVVAGKNAYAPFPHVKGYDNWTQAIGGWVWGITNESKKQKEAWDFMTYVLRHNVEMVKKRSTACFFSTYANPELRKARPWWDAVDVVYGGRGFLWARPPIPEFNDLQIWAGELVNSAMIGKMTVKQALDELQKRFQKRLDRAGYYKKGINPLPPDYFENART